MSTAAPLRLPAVAKGKGSSYTSGIGENRDSSACASVAFGIMAHLASFGMRQSLGLLLYEFQSTYTGVNLRDDLA